MIDSVERGKRWEIVEQSQSDHLGDYCTLSHGIEYEYGIFEVRQRIHDDATGYAEGKRRVDLIASAPELLEALRECRDRLERWAGLFPQKWAMEDEQAHDKAEAAIAKAEGRS